MKILYLFLFVSAFGFSQIDDLETSTWQEDKPLTWADFRGQPNNNMDAAALTASGISFGYSLKKVNSKVVGFEADIKSIFYPTESWYKKSEATPHILRHEQLHYNITELFARKFRYEVSKLKPSRNLKNQLSALGQRLNIEAEQMQRQYDAQTNHSINKKQQAEWDKFITSELKKLDAYKAK